MLTVRLAAFMGFLAVVSGAFGAHVLKHILTENNSMAIWQTAVLYHLIHAVGGLVLAENRPHVTWTWCIGIVLFSGSLYALALAHQHWLGYITPLGGICFLLGWLMCFKRVK